jgi:hypothetical protein
MPMTGGATTALEATVPTNRCVLTSVRHGVQCVHFYLRPSNWMHQLLLYVQGIKSRMVKVKRLGER